MKVLYIHQYFVTPEEDGTSRSYWFAKKLIENGHKVTMITSTNEFLHKEACTTNIDGINVVYVKNDYNQKFSKFKKIQSFISFIFKAFYAAKTYKNYDIVYATSTPLTVGFIALLLKKIKKMPFIFEVRDLWPDFPIQIGAITNPILIWILKKLEKSIYINSEHIVALSPGMAEGVYKCGISKDRISMIPNMSKIDLYYPREKHCSDFLKYGIDENCFNVVHAGAMGVANDLMFVIRTAEYLQYTLNNSKINFIIVGDGATKEQLEDYVNKKKLLNVKFLGHWGTADTSLILNCCDISLVCFKNLPILYTNSPNKLFDSLSAGKPIVVNSAGWTKDLVEQNSCGFYVHPEKPDEFATKLINISNNSALLEEYANNARNLAVTQYDKSILTRQFLQVIEHTIN